MSLERIAVVSDTHLCSTSERLDLLGDAYKFLSEERGVSTVFHAGDITDGYKVYKGQEFFLKCYGADDQANYVCEHYPQIKGVTTRFILGNHDMKHFDTSGVDIGKIISRDRPDLVYLGQYFARVQFDKATLDLVHPSGGFSYAISYPLQRYVNELEGGSKANILIMGHYHRTLYTVYRNINCLMPGAFQDQNDYTRRRGLQPNKGFWIIEFEHDTKGISMFRPEWHAYYELKDTRIVEQMSKLRDEPLKKPNTRAKKRLT